MENIRRREKSVMWCCCFLLLLHAAAVWPGEACAAAAEGTSREAVLLCRGCGHELADGADIQHVPSRLALSHRNHSLPGGRRIHVQMFENPHGHQFEVITFKKADVTKHWPAEETFTWFPGFSWTLATCPRCRSHLGWAFQPSIWPATVPQTTFEEGRHTFVALIVSKLLTEDFASSLLLTPKSFTS